MKLTKNQKHFLKTIKDKKIRKYQKQQFKLQNEFENRQIIKQFPFPIVDISFKEEFEKVYPYLRSAKYTSFKDWVKEFGYPIFPIYLEKAASVFSGESIGFTSSPVDTWTKEPLEILHL